MCLLQLPIRVTASSNYIFSEKKGNPSNSDFQMLRVANTRRVRNGFVETERSV
jgi:hypothetical protein